MILAQTVFFRLSLADPLTGDHCLLLRMVGWEPCRLRGWGKMPSLGSAEAEGGGRVLVACWALGWPWPSWLGMPLFKELQPEIGVEMKESRQETLKSQAVGNEAGWGREELLLNQNIWLDFTFFLQFKFFAWKFSFEVVSFLLFLLFQQYCSFNLVFLGGT